MKSITLVITFALVFAFISHLTFSEQLHMINNTKNFFATMQVDRKLQSELTTQSFQKLKGKKYCPNGPPPDSPPKKTSSTLVDSKETPIPIVG